MVNKLAGLIILLCLLGSNLAATGQVLPAKEYNGKDRIGLSLSGGGAKGLAYIGLLKKIDSLGLKVDYLTGTSMGAIIGGLYAMGYSGKDLESIVLSIDWKRALSNAVPLTKINIEEKDEYGKYLIEMPIKNGIPRLPSALIEGQYLTEIINTYTFPYRKTNDFSKFPIPFSVATTDIVTGNTIIQKSGSPALALLASMSIPSIFSNIYIDHHRLVDGGVSLNYPATEVRNMGAEFVIGGYTGFHLLKNEKMESPMNQLMQALTISGSENTRKQLERTDLLIDYTQALIKYSSSDFSKFKEILLEGENEVQLYLPQLKEIADRQKKAGIKPNSRQVDTSQIPIAEYKFYNEKNDSLTNLKEVETLKSLWPLKPDRFYNSSKIDSAIDKIYGTRFYKKVFYSFTDTEKGLQMNVNLQKNERGTFKAALHYDTDQSAGIIVNYTYYDLLLRKSRFLASVDIAERLKSRVDYYKFLGDDNKFWLKANAEYRNQKSNDIILSLLSPNVLRSQPPDYFVSTIGAGLGLGLTLSRSMYVYTGAGYEYERVYKGRNIVRTILGVDNREVRYTHSNQQLFLRLVQNNMTSQYFAVKGNKLNLHIKYTINNAIHLERFPEAEGLTDITEFLSPNSPLYQNPGEPGNILRFSVNEQMAFPIMKKFSFKLSANIGTISSQHFGTATDSYLYLNNYFGLGGIDEHLRDNNIAFIGLRQGEVPLRGFSSFSAGIQYNPFKSLYVSPLVSYAAESIGYNVAANLFKKDEAIFGYGIDLGYMSIIGPVHFVIAKAKMGTQLSFPWRGYLSLGFKF